MSAEKIGSKDLGLTGFTPRVEPITSSLDALDPQLQSIGMTPELFRLLYIAVLFNDTDTIESIVEISEARLSESAVAQSNEPSSEYVLNDEDNKIIDNLFKSNKGKDGPASLTVVAGSYAAGKSEIVEKYYDGEKYFVIDLDHIRNIILGPDLQYDQGAIHNVRERLWKISDAVLMRALIENRAVVIQSSLHRMDRWDKDPGIQYAITEKIRIQVDTIIRPTRACLTRNLSRPRSTTIKDMLESVKVMEAILHFADKYREHVSQIILRDYFPLEIESDNLPTLYDDDAYIALMQIAGNDTDFWHVETMRTDLAVSRAE